MSLKELLDRLERIRDGFLDASDRHMIEGMAEDISTLMSEIEKDGIGGDPDYGDCCTIKLNKK